MEVTKRIYTSARGSILSTAKAILLEQGIGHLTTDNLVSRSGLSKGGFFYHFKTINDLVLCLAEELIDEMEKTVFEMANKDKVIKGATLRAYINYALADEAKEHRAISRGIIEVLLSQRHLNIFIPKYDAFVKRLMNEGIDKQTARTILFALDGFWYNDLFGLNFMSKKEESIFLKGLIKQTY